MRLRFSIGMSRESFAVELEQVGRVEQGGVVPVSAEEVENGEGRFRSPCSSEGMGEINQRAFAPTGNGGRDAPSSPARERRSPAGAALGTELLLGVRRLFGSVLAGRIRRRG
jgi:hypothetical protein